MCPISMGIAVEARDLTRGELKKGKSGNKVKYMDIYLILVKG